MNIIAPAVLVAVLISLGLGLKAIITGELRLSHETTLSGTSAKIVGGIGMAIAATLVVFLVWFNGYALHGWGI